jgi:peptidoglycan/LPS O-acetylase OafA/YrhL
MEVSYSSAMSKRLKFNNFPLIRFVLALVICLVHSSQLSGFAELEFIDRALSSGLRVKAFFVISGFLVFMSYERSTSLRSYVKKRIRRIYPTYFTVIVMCAIGLFFISSKSASEYFSSGWLKYLIANLTFLNTLQLSLPGVFEGRHDTAVNGALWTMKIEVMFYAAVPIFVYMFKRFGRLPIIALAYFLSIAYVLILDQIFVRTGIHMYVALARQFPGQVAYFMVGGAAYYYLPFFERNIKTLLPAAAAVLFLDHSYALPLVSPIALGIIVIFCALFFYMGNFSKYGDFSYGIYILHFPIIQILLDSHWFEGRPFAFLASVVVLTAIGAMAIWNLVESRFIRRTGAITSPVVTPILAVSAAAQVAPEQ